MDNKDNLLFPHLVAEAQANARSYDPGDVFSCFDHKNLAGARTKMELAMRQFLVSVDDALDEVRCRAILDKDQDFLAEYQEHASDFRDRLAKQVFNSTLAKVLKEEEG